MGESDNKKYAVAILLLLAGTMLIDFVVNDRIFFGLFDEEETEVIAQESSFKYSGVREDATSTSVTSATTRVWYDENSDGVMQYSELGSFTESSGVYTSNKEDYPIGVTFWVQAYAANHFVTYEQVTMTGQRNSDGSAKSVGQIELRQST